MSKSGLMLGPCIAWALPGAAHYDESLIPKSDTELRNNGTIFHRWIAGESDPEVDVTTDQTKYMAMYQHAKAWLDEEIDPLTDNVRHEVVYAVNWATEKAEVFQGIKDRQYPYDDYPGYQFGTADLDCIRYREGHPEVVIGDWKTGEGLDAGAEKQLLSLLYGAWRVFQETYVGLAPKLKTVCLKVTETGVYADWHEYTEDDLECHASAMTCSLAKIGSGQFSERVMGLHCTAQYCPHLGHCDAVKEAIVTESSNDTEAGKSPTGELLPAESLLRKVTGDPCSDAEAGYTMAVIAAARRRMKYIENGVKNYLANGGQAVCDNYEWSSGSNGYRWRKART